MPDWLDYSRSDGTDLFCVIFSWRHIINEKIERQRKQLKTEATEWKSENEKRKGRQTGNSNQREKEREKNCDKNESFKANYDNSFLLPIDDAARVLLFRNNHAIVMSAFFCLSFAHSLRSISSHSDSQLNVFLVLFSKSPIHQLCLLFHADCFSGSVFLSPCFVVSMRLKYKHVQYTRLTHKNGTEPWKKNALTKMRWDFFHVFAFTRRIKVATAIQPIYNVPARTVLMYIYTFFSGWPRKKHANERNIR